jgi:hypothetical protein
MIRRRRPVQGLRDRIAAVNGTLTIDSQPGPARSYERGCQSTDRTEAEYRTHVKAWLSI